MGIIIRPDNCNQSQDFLCAQCQSLHDASIGYGCVYGWGYCIPRQILPLGMQTNNQIFTKFPR